jgi:hypothetical protein
VTTDHTDLIVRLRIPTSFGSPHLERQAADALEAQAAELESLQESYGQLLANNVAQAARIAELEAAAPAQPASQRERWNIERDDGDLLVCFNTHEKGEKCEYQRFVPAAPAQPAEPCRYGYICDKHYVIPPQPLTLSDEQIKMMAREIYHAPLAWEDWSSADVRFARAVLAAAQGWTDAAKASTSKSP